MANGTLGMVACPILEDEMVYNLSTDAEEKNVFVLENEYCGSAKRKLSEAGIPFESLDESAFIDAGAPLPEGAYNVVIYMMDMGLHQEPEDLGSAIKERLLGFQHRVDAVMLYYGLCGKGLEGIEEWGSENLSVPITILKDAEGKVCDDCIAVPVGGTDNYLRLLKEYPGVMYLTPCVACNFDEFLNAMELTRGIEGSGRDREEMLRMILEMADYRHALKIQTGLGDQDLFQAKAEEFCEKYNLELLYLEGDWVTPVVADRTYAEAKGFLNAG
ncbi:MAG: DUF1638 domain-containing protein [Thermoplasmatales archaeon]|nr:DUF1638 domain-containing protein [Thermoplasmatales archaeon]